MPQAYSSDENFNQDTGTAMDGSAYSGSDYLNMYDAGNYLNGDSSPDIQYESVMGGDFDFDSFMKDIDGTPSGTEKSLMQKGEEFAKENPFTAKLASALGFAAVKGYAQNKQMEDMMAYKDKKDQEERDYKEKIAKYATHKPIQTGLLNTVMNQQPQQGVRA